MAISNCFLACLILLTYQTTGKEIQPNFTVRSRPQSITTSIPTSRSFFSSRLEYNNKWLPVGRGDPLKNDPTYDYSPPAIHYWDEKSTINNGNKNEILLLGVSSRRQFNNNFERRPSDISTVMLPPPIQPMQNVNFKKENGPSTFTVHKTWQDSQATGSNVHSSIVLPNTAPTMYQQFNSDADDVNKLLSHEDSHPPMFMMSHSKKSWIQDLLQKEVTKPTTSSHVNMERLTLLKLDDTNQFDVKWPAESKTEMTPPYFVPTIHPSIANDNKMLFQEIPKPVLPMNLIIQGHSRVKTYGQGTEERDPKIIEVKGVEHPVVNRVVSKDENGVQFDVKHLHVNSANKNAPLNATKESKNSTVASLLSLLDLSFGDFVDSSSDAVNQTKLNEIKTL